MENPVATLIKIVGTMTGSRLDTWPTPTTLRVFEVCKCTFSLQKSCWVKTRPAQPLATSMAFNFNCILSFLSGRQCTVPIIECHLYLPSYLSPEMTQELGSFIKQYRLSQTFAKLQHTHVHKQHFLHTLLPCHLPNTSTNYRLPIHFLLQIIDQLQNSTCFLHHIVTLAPSITQELSWT